MDAFWISQAVNIGKPCPVAFGVQIYSGIAKLFPGGFHIIDDLDYGISVKVHSLFF
jgi:hypothetical protein